MHVSTKIKEINNDISHLVYLCVINFCVIFHYHIFALQRGYSDAAFCVACEA